MANKSNIMLPVIKHDESINYILCPVCGCPFKPNDRNLCLKCLSEEIDITSEIIKKNEKLSIKQCYSCKRWYNSFKLQWKVSEIGSPDLKDMLLRKLKGLHKKENKIIKSSFINNNASKKRIVIEIHLQKDIIFDIDKNITIDGIFCIEFKIENVICKECKISSDLYSSWKSCVQIKQNENLNHSRLFLFLEQLLIKHHHQSFTNCISIEETKNGFYFYFDKESVARMFINHLNDIIAIHTNVKKQQIANSKNCGTNNIQKYKTTYCCELASICLNDLCLIPLALQKKCGGHSPLMICNKVSSSLHFIDPTSLHFIELNSKQYFRYYNNFAAIASVSDLCVFYVINVNKIKGAKGAKGVKGAKGLWEIELIRESDLGENNDEILESITNLDWLSDGDMIEGYDINKLSNTIDLFGNEMKNFIKKHKIPDVIIIQKYIYYDLKINKKRKWKLKRMDNVKMANNYKMDKYTKEKRIRDYEIFLNQIKLHKQLRAQINIYKNEQYDEYEEKDNNDLEHIDESELINETPLNVIKANDIEMDNDNND